MNTSQSLSLGIFKVSELQQLYIQKTTLNIKKHLNFYKNVIYYYTVLYFKCRDAVRLLHLCRSESGGHWLEAVCGMRYFISPRSIYGEEFSVAEYG